MKLGFIGGSGHHYLRGLLSDPTAGLLELAVGSDNADAPASVAFAERLRQQFPDRSIAYFDDGRALLDTFRPDVLSVGAVYADNGTWNVEALSRNVPIVSDKPIATTWDRLRELEQLIAADPKRVLLTEFDFRSRPTFRAAWEAVRAGRIGTVVLVSAQKSYRWNTRPAWYADRARYGGLLLWVASHAIDATQFVTGLPIVRGTGTGGNLTRPDYGTSEDHVAVLGTLEGGAGFTLHADFGRPAAAATHGDDRMRVVGSKGLIEIRDDVCLLTTADTPEQKIVPAQVPEPMHRELLAAVRAGGSEWYSTAESLRTAAVLLALRDAADRREWLDMPVG